MTNQEAINEFQSAIDLIKQDGKDWLDERDIPILEMAIAALEAQEIRDLLPVSPLLGKKKKKRKREAISAPQPQELSNNSPKLNSENGELATNLQPTCNQLATEVISRQAAIDIVVFECGEWTGLAKEISKQLKQLPSAQPEIIRCKDCLHAIKDALCGGYWCKGKVVTSNHYCGYAERKE